MPLTALSDGKFITAICTVFQNFQPVYDRPFDLLGVGRGAGFFSWAELFFSNRKQGFFLHSVKAKFFFSKTQKQEFFLNTNVV